MLLLHHSVLSDLMNCRPPSSSVPVQTRILEWVAICFSRGSFCPRVWTEVSHITDSLPSEPIIISSFQFSRSVESNSVTPWTAACQAFLFITNYRSPPKPVHWVGDAIQPSHPLSSPSPPALNLSQHKGLFKWVSSSHQVAKMLEFQLPHQSFPWTPRTDFL